MTFFVALNKLLIWGVVMVNGNDLTVVHSLQRSLDYTAAILLLTGQITIIGVFVRPNRFSLSTGGPLFGGKRLEGINGSKAVTVFIDILDIIVAVLIIIDEINVTGSFVSSSEFSINVSGPIFGYPKVLPALPIEEHTFFHTIVNNHFQVPSELMTKLRGTEQNVVNRYPHSEGV